MSPSLLIRPAAEADLREAYGWYEAQQSGLGTQFLAEVDRGFEGICEQPKAFAEVHRGVRRALIRRFPYCIFFLPEADRIVVLAVLHASRDPRMWQSRREA